MRKTVVIAALSLALLVSMLSSGTSSAAATPVSGVATIGAAPASAGPNLNWKISKGVQFNDPRDHTAWKIIDKIKRTIKNTPGGEKIWVMTWNLQSKGIVKQLIRAHERGVRVRLIMARELANAQGYHGSFRTLKRGLRKGNADRPWRRRSWARTCDHSCRGWGGSMHSKFMMVSKSGARSKIVSQGSANFTTAAATRQWNDWYTVFGQMKIWKTYKKVFKEAKKDKRFPTVQTWQGSDKTTAWFAPWYNGNDKVMKILKKVKCWGARGAGVNGKTAIRVASSVFQNKRGQRIASKLKELHNKGCNIRVVFTMMPNKIRDILAGVPTQHLAYDWDGDGGFDRYLHMKVMTVSGHWAGDRGHRLVFNGSANWSRIGAISDEQGMVVHKYWQEKFYARQINELFNVARNTVTASRAGYQGHNWSDYEDLELELAHQG